MRRVVGVALFLAVTACGEPTAPPSEEDASGRDAAVPMDGASGVCTADSACDDGLFCNGAERCTPTASGAGEDGCVAGSPACDDGSEVCDEEADTCSPSCGRVPDADGDGHDHIDCAGDDCDDEDANRFPGNSEICDSAGHDEDCNEETFGFVDADGDGVGSTACCNGTSCGGDCDDANSNVNPGALDGSGPACDGLDNDCSGVADEGCTCMVGVDRECGTDAMLGREGVCRPGTQYCVGGSWAATCVGGVSPGEEICDTLDNDCDGTVDEGVQRTYYADADGDGYGVSDMTTQACSPPVGWASAPGDCDDAVAGVSPRAADVCNGIDDNCNGMTDEGVTRAFNRDADGDGYGDPGMTMSGCFRPDGYTDDASDCDDGAGPVHPGAAEVCDGIDNDCNGTIDPGCSCTDGTTRACGTSDVGECARGTQRCAGGAWGECVGAIEPRAETCNGLDDDCDAMVDDGVLQTFYADGDGDGFGSASTSTNACALPTGYSALSTDCDDTRAASNPAASDRCNGLDDDCDGVIDPGCECTNGETRGCGSSDVGECTRGTQRCVEGLWGACVGMVDPRTESCNGLDDDCDGAIDDGVQNTYYADTDGDAFGVASTTVMACAQPPGYSALSTDCDDTSAAINPAAVERCNTVDDNCASGTDEGCSCTDGTTRACGTVDPGGGFVTAGECATGLQQCVAGTWGACVGAIAPASESCNGLDDDCDGSVDDGVLSTYYRDVDGDAFGVAATTTTACAQPPGYSVLSTDCNDADAAISPASFERCNGVDDNCVSGADEGCSCTDGATRACGATSTGECATGLQQCVAGSWGTCVGEVVARPESCNGLDDDCDGTVDDGVKSTYYIDGDGDGFGSSTTTTTACAQPPGYAVLSTDCDDTNAAINPASVERCNTVDDNCGGGVDEGCSCTDGATQACGTTDAGGAIITAGECADGVQQCVAGTWGACIGSVGPRAETCNTLDDDCDASVDEGMTASCYADGDGDAYGTGAIRTVCAAPGGGCPTGYSSAPADCNDGAPTVRPGAAEACNGIDDDCDGDIDETVTRTCFGDADGDGFGGGSPLTLCAVAGSCPAGYAAAGGDCNDSSSTVRPGLAETCNGIDDDCSGAIDDGFMCARGAETTCTTTCGTAGTQSCRLDCTGYTACEADLEVCNGCDDDADASVDESFTCVRDSTGNACVTSCGSVGTYTCSSTCTAGACSATEQCNGCDDDGDGTADNRPGFGCALGASRACVTGCGTAGFQSCQADCSGWGPCRATSDPCNGCDDDLDGAADDENDCVQGEIIPCATACGTPGVRTCTAACALPMACYAYSEYCNYCDDNGASGISDEVGIASSSREVEFRLCSDVVLAGSAVAASCGTGGTIRTRSVVDLVTTSSQTGAIGLASNVFVGYGPVEIPVTAYSDLGTSTYPAYGWALVVYEADLASPVLGTGGTNLGVNHARTGFSAEWRFYNGTITTQADQVSLRPLAGGTADAVFSTVSAMTGQHLDSGATASVRQDLTLVIHPDFPWTTEREDFVELYDGAGTLLISRSGSGLGAPAVRFYPGDVLHIGITAATGTSDANVAAIGSVSGAVSQPGALQADSSQLCP